MPGQGFDLTDRIKAAPKSLNPFSEENMLRVGEYLATTPTPGSWAAAPVRVVSSIGGNLLPPPFGEAAAALGNLGAQGLERRPTPNFIAPLIAGATVRMGGPGLFSSMRAGGTANLYDTLAEQQFGANAPHIPTNEEIMQGAESYGIGSALGGALHTGARILGATPPVRDIPTDVPPPIPPQGPGFTERIRNMFSRGQTPSPMPTQEPELPYDLTKWRLPAEGGGPTLPGIGGPRPIPPNAGGMGSQMTLPIETSTGFGFGGQTSQQPTVFGPPPGGPTVIPPSPIPTVERPLPLESGIDWNLPTPEQSALPGIGGPPQPRPVFTGVPESGQRQPELPIETDIRWKQFPEGGKPTLPVKIPGDVAPPVRGKGLFGFQPFRSMREVVEALPSNTGNAELDGYIERVKFLRGGVDDISGMGPETFRDYQYNLKKIKDFDEIDPLLKKEINKFNKQEGKPGFKPPNEGAKGPEPPDFDEGPEVIIPSDTPPEGGGGGGDEIDLVTGLTQTEVNRLMDQADDLSGQADRIQRHGGPEDNVEAIRLRQQALELYRRAGSQDDIRIQQGELLEMGVDPLPDVARQGNNIEVKRMPNGRNWGLYKDGELHESFFSHDAAKAGAERLRKELDPAYKTTWERQFEEDIKTMDDAELHRRRELHMDREDYENPDIQSEIDAIDKELARRQAEDPDLNPPTAALKYSDIIGKVKDGTVTHEELQKALDINRLFIDHPDVAIQLLPAHGYDDSLEGILRQLEYERTTLLTLMTEGIPPRVGMTDAQTPEVTLPEGATDVPITADTIESQFPPVVQDIVRYYKALHSALSKGNITESTQAIEQLQAIPRSEVDRLPEEWKDRIGQIGQDIIDRVQEYSRTGVSKKVLDWLKPFIKDESGEFDPMFIFNLFKGKAKPEETIQVGLGTFRKPKGTPSRTIPGPGSTSTDKPGWFTTALREGRQLKTTFDASWPLRQGITNITRPEFWTALKETATDLHSEANYQKLLSDIKALPEYSAMKKAGVEFTELGDDVEMRPEDFRGSILEKKVPGIRWSNRLFDGMSNKLKVALWKSMSRDFKLAGVDLGDGSSKEAKELASFINDTTGRGKLPERWRGHSTLINDFMFAPKFIASRVNMLRRGFSRGIDTSIDPRARRILQKQGIRAMAGVGGLAATSWLMTGAIRGFDDPDAKPQDIGKIRMGEEGETRLDFTGGFQGYVRNAIQFAHQVGTHDPAAANTMLRFIRGKLAPLPATAWNIAATRDITGDPVTPLSVAADLAAPLIAEDIYELYMDDPAMLPIGAPAAFFGAGVDTFEDNPKDDRVRRRNRVRLPTTRTVPKFTRPPQPKFYRPAQ